MQIVKHMNYGQHSSSNAASNCRRYTGTQAHAETTFVCFVLMTLPDVCNPLTVQQLHLHGTEYKTSSGGNELHGNVITKLTFNELILVNGGRCAEQQMGDLLGRLLT